MFPNTFCKRNRNRIFSVSVVVYVVTSNYSGQSSLFYIHIQDDTVLVVGWGTSVKIASIKTNQNKGLNGSYKYITMSSLNQVDIVASFQTSYFISGIAPFGDSLVVLAYIPAEEDGEKNFSSTIPSRQVSVFFSLALDLTDPLDQMSTYFALSVL